MLTTHSGSPALVYLSSVLVQRLLLPLQALTHRHLACKTLGGCKSKKKKKKKEKKEKKEKEEEEEEEEEKEKEKEKKKKCMINYVKPHSFRQILFNGQEASMQHLGNFSSKCCIFRGFCSVTAIGNLLHNFPIRKNSHFFIFPSHIFYLEDDNSIC